MEQRAAAAAAEAQDEDVDIFGGPEGAVDALAQYYTYGTCTKQMDHQEAPLDILSLNDLLDQPHGGTEVAKELLALDASNEGASIQTSYDVTTNTMPQQAVDVVMLGREEEEVDIPSMLTWNVDPVQIEEDCEQGPTTSVLPAAPDTGTNELFHLSFLLTAAVEDDEVVNDLSRDYRSDTPAPTPGEPHC
ncbi:Hypothetical protein, putative [Bodo saltans]|uniref:Uncharacterized protein n=1 Tax=Bodo saltans TaxID=75058 RepID=A0A0S4JRE3_BODSA|nr:Hypothetical protein, putative [Bodo saltans]|eukprot:CUG92751.1 Hypothetical protein, putative [Bodo saltans]